MKKVFIIALVSVASSLFSQTGKVGINTPTPSSTLDIQPNTANAATTATTAEGLLIPRLSRLRVANMGTTPATSTLVYVNSVADGSAAGTTANVDAVGFYYFNGSVWVKLNAGAGASVTASNGLTATGSDVKLGGTLSEATAIRYTGTTNTLTLGNADGTGILNVWGRANFWGSELHKYDIKTGNVTTLDNTEFTLIKNDTGDTTYNLPSGVQNGRTACLINGATSGNLLLGTNMVSNATSLGPNQSACFMFVGVTGKWMDMSNKPAAAAPAEGTFTRNIRTYATATDTMTSTDYFVVNKYLSGSSTVTLPASPANGRTVCVMNTNTTGDVLMSGGTIVGPNTVYGGYTGCWIYNSSDLTWYTSSAN